MKYNMIIMVLLLFIYGCKQTVNDPIITTRWADNFDRIGIGQNWLDTSQNNYSRYKISNNELVVQGARNHPLWLRKRLPENVRIEFDVWSNSQQGDIKFEIFGDGHSYATQSRYFSTSYVLIFGGWHNSRSIIARRDEHAPNQPNRTNLQVEMGKIYKMKIERINSNLKWFIDNNLFLELNDPEPLKGRGHEYFGFNDWEVELHFDNLIITPL